MNYLFTKKNQNYNNLFITQPYTVNLIGNNIHQGWKEWFAGIIDGDGSILIYKNLVSIEITTDIADKGILLEIAHVFGGNIKNLKNKNAIRWRIAKKEIVKRIINTINGNIRHTYKIEKLKKACAFFNIEYIAADFNISLNNSYFSGFFDADGSIVLSSKNKIEKYRNIPGILGKVERLIHSKGENNCNISCAQKDYENIKIFNNLNMGKIYQRNQKNTNSAKYIWRVFYKDIDKFLNYIQLHPLKSQKKKHRASLLNKYVILKKNKAHLSKSDSIEFLDWTKFCYEWYELEFPNQ